MPELPEVETVRLQLLHKVAGKTIASIIVHHQKTVGYQAGFKKKLTGRTIEHIDRVGKLLIFSFTDEPDLFLLAHLKMTGQFFYAEESGVSMGGGHTMNKADSQDLPNKHTRVSFYFTDGSALHFNDMRIFGYTKIANKSEAEAIIKLFGPEPIHDTFDVQSFTQKLMKRRIAIKAALLDQSLLAGLGNIYVDETLWQAKVSPLRPANEVSAREAALIAKAAGAIMNKAIKYGGTTFQNFADTEGRTGNFLSKLKVFGQTGRPCPRCQTPIKKIRVAGRGTHYCPICQK